MKKFIGYILVFVLGFTVCALVLRDLYGPTVNEGVSISSTTNRGAPAFVTGGNNPIRVAAEKLEKSVVNIDTVGRPVAVGFPDFFGLETPKQETPKGQASGVIYRSDGYIITNNHVVQGAEQIYITLYNGRKYKAKVIGRDPRTDLAVIKVDATGLPAATFADVKSLKALQVGDWTIAVGNPLGIGTTVTAGIVSATSRDVDGSMEDMIQTDAPINKGNSGGALADINGNVIGINTAIASPNGGSIGIGFARRSTVAVDIANKLIKEGKIVYPWLGIMYIVMTDEIRHDLQAQGEQVPPVNGAQIKQVVPGSPADRAGLMPLDVITDINGKKVTAQKNIADVVRAAKVGQIVDLTVWHARTNQTTKVSVRTAEMPQGL